MLLKIPINIPLVGREEISAAASVLRNGALTSSVSEVGRHVQAFEKAAALLLKSKYVVAVNSGNAPLQA